MTDGRHQRGPGARANLAALLADALAEFANATLSLDAVGMSRLAALDGRELELRARNADGTEAVFTLRVAAGRLRLTPTGSTAPLTVVTGTPGELLEWALSLGRRTPAGLRIDGDSRFLEDLAEVAHGFAPDLEAPLRRVLGADAATRVVATAELALTGLRTLFEGAADALRQGAAQWFAAAPAVTTLLDELDDLQLRVDRLSARVTLAEQRRADPPTTP